MPNVFVKFPNFWFKNGNKMCSLCNFSLEVRLLTFIKFNNASQEALKRKKQFILGKITFQPIFEKWGLNRSVAWFTHSFKWFGNGLLALQAHLNYMWRQLGLHPLPSCHSSLESVLLIISLLYNEWSTPFVTIEEKS